MKRDDPKVAIGSAVRPDVVSADLDLIVISAEAAPSHISHPMEIDLRVYPAATIDRQIASGRDLLGWAIKFGKALFQREHFWDRVTTAWKGRLPLPSSALARERAGSAYERLTKMLESGDADAVHELAVSYLTHLARAELLNRGVYPASRPELPAQLRAGAGCQVAEQLESQLEHDGIDDADKSSVEIDRVKACLEGRLFQGSGASLVAVQERSGSANSGQPH